MITADRSGFVWLYNDGQNVYNLLNDALSIRDGIDDADPRQSNVLGFGTSAIYVQAGKYPRDVRTFLIDPLRDFSSDIPLTVDQQDRIWFYHPEKGLVVQDHGSTDMLGRVPDKLSLSQPGAVLPLQSGKVWVGGDGLIWEFDQNQWHKIVVQKANQRFTRFTQDSLGTIYGATGEGVYQFNGDTYSAALFVKQEYKLLIVPDDGKLEPSGKCSFHKRYAVTGNCPDFWGKASSEYVYQVRYLNVEQDGSVVYINDHVVARLKDGQWKSFAFDTFSIDSATVDKYGNIWIFSNWEGLFKLSANIFDDYVKLTLPSSE